MTDPHEANRPDWLEEFENLANDRLDEGSACEQVHPLIATWYKELMAGDPPEARDSVWQALQCLTTEVLNDIPLSLVEILSSEEVDEDLADWVTELLLIGRAFQIGLQTGRLDDL